MNHLAPLMTLRNRYFVLRHGESLANRAGLIVSAPPLGTTQYGLTARGRCQVAASLAQSTVLDASTCIYSSDFTRARESAVIAQTVLHTTRPIVFSIHLRERYFGSWDLTSHTHYQRVWAEDRVNPQHTHNAVESVTEVLERVTRLVRAIEAQGHGQHILLVSHGDVLQILQTGFGKQNPAAHRQLPPLHTAELRELRLAI